MNDQMTAMQYMLYDKQKKSVFIAYLVGFFLWMFGLHCFYAHQNAHGVLRLILGVVGLIFPPMMVVAALVALFDGVFTYFLVQDANKRIYAEIMMLK